MRPASKDLTLTIVTEVEPRTVRHGAALRPAASRISRSRLNALRVGELRDLALSLGVGNVSTMRKGTLVDAIDERLDITTQDSTTEPTGTDLRDDVQDDVQDTTSPEEQQQAPDAAEPGPTPAEDAVAEAEGSGEEPAEASTENEASEPAPAAEEPAAEEPAADQPAAGEPTPAENAVSEAEGGAETPDAVADTTGPGDPKSAASHVNSGITGIAEDLQELQRETTEGEPAEGDGEPRGRRGRGRGRGRSGQQGGQQAEKPQQQEAAKAEPQQQGGQDRQQGGQQQSASQQAAQPQSGQQAGQIQDGDGRRGRYRDRKRRGQGEFDEPEVRDDDVLIPIAGILDVLDNYAFVRTSGYLSGPNDVYVSLGQVKKYHLRRGDAVVGSIRQVPDTEQSTRQKYNALVKVDSINGLPVTESEGRVEFGLLTAVHPTERLRLETEPQKAAARTVDLVTPIGKGSRGLIIGAPKSGKTVLLQSIANAIPVNNPEVHLMVVLVDERPEEVTDLQRSVKGEVIASTFERAPEDHTTVAELAIDRAKRLVELGYDVVVLLDSITRLVKAYDRTVTPSGRLVAVGLDAAALQPAKEFFGAARNVENGGSLTILATATDASASVVDAAVLEEFAGAANLELHLDGGLAVKRIFPAVDIAASATRREEALMGPDEVKVTWQLRRALTGMTTQQAAELVLGKLRETGSNTEFLVQMQKSLPGGTSGK